MVCPLLTIFAGPNGSGKSTLKRTIGSSKLALGVYINADEIAREMLKQAVAAGQHLPQRTADLNAFHEAERRRQSCLADRRDFSFETVFSHPSKVDLIRAAKLAGYRVLLYFVSTENSLLNVERVAKRVREGGHDVDTEKIIARYRRAMELLVHASAHVDELALFDNSGSEMRLAVHMTWPTAPLHWPPHIQIFGSPPRWVMQWAHEVGPTFAPARAIRASYPVVA